MVSWHLTIGVKEYSCQSMALWPSAQSLPHYILKGASLSYNLIHSKIFKCNHNIHLCTGQTDSSVCTTVVQEKSCFANTVGKNWHSGQELIFSLDEHSNIISCYWCKVSIKKKHMFSTETHALCHCSNTQKLVLCFWTLCLSSGTKSYSSRGEMNLTRKANKEEIKDYIDPHIQTYTEPSQEKVWN